MFVERILTPWVLIPILVSLAYAVYKKITTHVTLPNLPWVGKREGSFLSKYKPRSAAESQQLYRDIYDNYSSKGLSCIYPPFIGAPEIVIPPAFIPWIVSQPESVLSAREHHRETLQSDFTMGDPIIVLNPLHEHVIRENLTKALKSVTEPVMDELKDCFNDYWAFDDWTEICVWEDMLKFFARTSNRIFVGLPLCRNEDFLKNCISYSQDISIASAILRSVPAIIKPFVIWPATMPNRKHYGRAAKYLKPVIEQRKADMERKRRDPDFKFEAPDDFITWSIQQAQERADSKELTADLLAKRYMVVSFAAIHTTALTITNVLLDIVSAPPEQRVLEEIREEVERVHREEGGKWNKNSLAKMYRTDSAIRESMRMHNFVNWGIQRKVMAKGGVTMSNGLHLPEGSNIAVQAYSLHRLPENYENPNKFDAFRFSRPRETVDASSDGTTTLKEDGVEPSHSRGVASVTTGDKFLHFGHGRYSCPGRFFAVQELKLLLAHLVVNYDIKPLAERPSNMWVGDTNMPPRKATIFVKRKAKTAGI